MRRVCDHGERASGEARGQNVCLGAVESVLTGPMPPGPTLPRKPLNHAAPLKLKIGVCLKPGKDGDLRFGIGVVGEQAAGDALC
jgi:hypothetical protein